MKNHKLLLALAVSGCIFANTIPALAASSADGTSPKDPWAQLEENGVISESTYDAITAYLEEHRPERPENSSSDGLQKERREESFCDNLVEEGILSQDTADAIQAYMEANRPERPEDETRERGKMNRSDSEAAAEDRTEAEKQRKEPAALWSSLLEADVITQEEYDNVTAYFSQLPEKPERAEGDEIKGRGGDRTAILSELLEADVITQEEYDNISSAMPELPEKRERKTADSQN